MTNLLVAQTDFSGGQVNRAALRRDDSQAVRTGGRVMRNWRCTSTSQLVPRPGRRPLFRCLGARTEKFRMANDVEVQVSFSAHAVAITGMDGTPALMSDGTPAAGTSDTYLWTDATLAQIYVTQALDELVLTYPGMRPQILRWDRSTRRWTFGQFSFDSAGNQSREPFYRFSLPGASMAYSAATGDDVVLECSQPYFTPQKVGARLSIGGQQCTIKTYISPTQAIVTIGFKLPEAISVPVADVSPFAIGQEVSSLSQPEYKFEVGKITTGSGTTGTVSGVLISSVLYPAVSLPSSDTLVSIVGSSATTGAPTKADLTTRSIPTTRWQEQFMSAQNGWPAASFYDNGRLGFCDFPQLGEAILWSAVNATTTFWIDFVAARLQPKAGATADSAMLEKITGRPRVRHVVGWGDTFVFTDRGIFQIPVSTSNPLQPGSVEFRQISNDGVSDIPPITTQDTIVYINAGQRRCSAVRATGAQTRPYVSDDLSEEHSDLFTGPVAMAITTGDGANPERYVYLVMADKTLVVGKFTADQKFVGWQPWDSASGVAWVTSSGPDLYYTSVYPSGAFVEIEDQALFLDAAIPVNTPPPVLAGQGNGSLWPLAGRTVILMDGNLDRGDRQVTTQGALAGIEGEDLSSPTLVAGLFAPCRYQPIFPAGQQGASVSQRQRRRRIARAQVTVRGHSGFTFGDRVFAAAEFGEDGGAAPLLKDDTYQVRPLGRDYDPTIELVKDRPGPITVCELSAEVTP